MSRQTETKPSFWDDRKSIALTRIVTVAIFFVCIAVTVMGPGIVDWLIARGRVGVQGPAVRWVMLGLGYLLAALALWMPPSLRILLCKFKQKNGNHELGNAPAEPYGGNDNRKVEQQTRKKLTVKRLKDSSSFFYSSKSSIYSTFLLRSMLGTTLPL